MPPGPQHQPRGRPRGSQAPQQGPAQTQTTRAALPKAPLVSAHVCPPPPAPCPCKRLLTLTWLGELQKCRVRPGAASPAAQLGNPRPPPAPQWGVPQVQGPGLRDQRPELADCPHRLCDAGWSSHLSRAPQDQGPGHGRTVDHSGRGTRLLEVYLLGSWPLPHIPRPALQSHGEKPEPQPHSPHTPTPTLVSSGQRQRGTERRSLHLPSPEASWVMTGPAPGPAHPTKDPTSHHKGGQEVLSFYQAV
ncbi:uncharacterized protein LOC114670564 [Macaca mulatta]